MRAESFCLCRLHPGTEEQAVGGCITDGLQATPCLSPSPANPGLFSKADSHWNTVTSNYVGADFSPHPFPLTS